LSARDIAYITVAENDRRDKMLTLTDGTKHLAKNVTFDYLLQRLPDGDFCRINRRMVVALSAVSSYTAQWVYCNLPGIHSPIQFALSGQYRDHFLARLPR